MIAIMQAGAGGAGGQRHVGAGLDGDVVLRPGRDHVGVARGLLAGAGRGDSVLVADAPRHPSHGTPAPAIWTIVLAAFAAMLWSGAVPIVTSLSTVALYVAYTIPIVFAWRARLRKSDWPNAAVWSLGRWGAAINVVAIAYAVFICVMLVMPPNELAGKTLLGLLVSLGVLYFASARRTYRGPEWSRTGH